MKKSSVFEKHYSVHYSIKLSLYDLIVHVSIDNIMSWPEYIYKVVCTLSRLSVHVASRIST